MALVKNGNFLNGAKGISTVADNWTWNNQGNGGIFNNTTLNGAYTNNRTVSAYPTGSGINYFHLFTDFGATVPVTIQQTITFPKAGNYVLSFWGAGSTVWNPAFAVNVSIGSIAANSVFYAASSPWRQDFIPFSVNSSQLSQVLTISTCGFNSGDFSVVVSNVVITSNDYCLDLFLEWIPEEEEKKYKRLY